MMYSNGSKRRDYAQEHLEAHEARRRTTRTVLYKGQPFPFPIWVMGCLCNVCTEQRDLWKHADKVLT